MIKQNWQDAIDNLGPQQLRYVIAYLLGRSGMTDEQFIARVEELLE